ncbi:MAG: methyl-accepting chemotaxis protein [Bacillota bacterium]
MFIVLAFITGTAFGFIINRLLTLVRAGKSTPAGGNAEVKVVSQLLRLLPVVRSSLEESVRATEEGVLVAAGAVGEVTARVRQGLVGMDAVLKIQQEGRSRREEEFNRVFLKLEGSLGLLRERMGAVEEMFRLIFEMEQKTRGEKLFSILSELKDISSSIRLVALNAAIEAARVGDEGRGFAVVAAEVQRLAGQSEKAVQSVNQFGQLLLKDIRDKMADIENKATALRSAAAGLADSQSEVRNMVAMHRQWDEAAAEDAASVAAELKTIDRHLDEGITAFQFQDAVAQQISHVRDILLRVEELLSGGDSGGSLDILKELEEMYTMESERATHRRVIRPDAGAGDGGGTAGNIEFF